MPAVNAPLLRSMKATLAVLCAALSVVFAGASTASVVDKIQHQAQAAHYHEHVVFSGVAVGDHHQDGDPAANIGDAAEVQDGDPLADHQPGNGHHHHTDGSTGILAVVDLLHAPPPPGARLMGGSDDLIPTRGSPGPDRPPKRLTTSA
jgi:hypothetical protein